jgi:hypothetical protein
MISSQERCKAAGISDFISSSSVFLQTIYLKGVALVSDY